MKGTSRHRDVVSAAPVSVIPASLAVGLVALATGCGGDGGGGQYAMTKAAADASTGATAAATTLAVRLTDDGCEPLIFTALAGDITFYVTNDVAGTGLKSEFEVLTKEPKILTEEFFAKHESRAVIVTMPSGDYEIICGAPSNPRATLVVVGAGGESTAILRVDSAALQANVDVYTDYVDGQLTEMVASNKALYDAIAADDLALARSRYMPARLQWERIEPIAELFPDSDAVLDSRFDDFEKGPTDPNFTGWHRLEYLMFDRSTLEGAEPFAAELARNIDILVTRIHGIAIDASTMINGSAALIEEAATGKITGEEERYAGTSLMTFASNVEGAKTIIDLNADLLRGIDPALDDTIEKSFATIDTGLAKYATGDGTYAQYDTLTDTDRASLQAELATLSENLSAVAAAFGLEVS